MTLKANGAQVGLAYTSGTMPATVVTVVSTIGRKRIAAESTTMSMIGLLGSSCR